MKKVLSSHDLVMHQGSCVISDNINELDEIVKTEIRRMGRIDVYWLCSLTFQYGVICGKREERKRRKKTL